MTIRLLFAVLALAGAILAAHAQEHRHGDTVIPGVTGKFYETWMRPDQPHLSCCNRMDCYATEARMVNGVWWARHRETGKFIEIDPKKIEHNRDNPDGQNHLCASSGSTPVVYCFIAGGGA